MRKWGKLSVSMNQIPQNQFFGGDDGYHPSNNNRVYSKDIRIRKLQERNDKLQHQVVRIQRALSSIGPKAKYGIKLPQLNVDVLKRELQNAYKAIKHYQYEISKRKQLDFEGAYVEKQNHYELVLRQKQALAQKLRQQVAQHRKQSIQYTKLLKNDALKREHEEKVTKMNADIKWLQEQVKKSDKKIQGIQHNQQREQQQIQHLQKQLMNLSYDKGFFETMRDRFLTGKAIIEAEIEMPEDNDQIELELSRSPQQRDILDPTDRTPQTYQIIMAELKVLKKLEATYEQRVITTEKQRMQAAQRNLLSRNKLVEVEYEIERVQLRIEQLKRMVNPKSLVPTKLKMIEEEKRKMFPKKIVKPKPAMPHFYPFQEVGVATQTGQRFIDRAIIGKQPAKIVGVIYYYVPGPSQDQHIFKGFQATYQVKTAKKKAAVHIMGQKQQCKSQSFDLDPGDFFRTIQALLDEKGSIVGVSMMSPRGVLARGGSLGVDRKTFEPEQGQCPGCLFGSWSNESLQLFGTQMGPQ